STSTVFQAAAAQNIPLVTLSPSDSDALNALAIDPTAKARIASALSAMMLVIVPSRDVVINGETVNAWFEANPQTGETTGVGEDGSHQALSSYAAVLTVSAAQKQSAEIGQAALDGSLAGQLLQESAEISLADSDPKSKAAEKQVLSDVQITNRMIIYIFTE